MSIFKINRHITSCKARTILPILWSRGQNMSDVEKRIGGKITEIRLTHGLTQAQLAEKVNISPESVSRMERGVTFPSLITIENIAATLNVPLKAFFDFDDYPSEDIAFERELSKLTALLRTLPTDQITLIRKILKIVFANLK